MFNPWVILGALLLVAALCTGSYLKGYKNAENAARAAHATALEEKIAEARQTAIQDMQIEQEWEKSRQAVKIVYRDRESKFQESINANPPKPECKLSEPSVRLLNDAIRDATNTAQPAKPAPVPTPATPNNRGNERTSAEVSSNG